MAPCVIKEQNVSSDVFEQYNLCVPFFVGKFVPFFVGKFVRETCTPSPFLILNPPTYEYVSHQTNGKTS
jgi:hypothetical protein